MPSASPLLALPNFPASISSTHRLCQLTALASRSQRLLDSLQVNAEGPDVHALPFRWGRFDDGVFPGFERLVHCETIKTSGCIPLQQRNFAIFELLLAHNIGTDDLERAFLALHSRMEQREVRLALICCPEIEPPSTGVDSQLGLLSRNLHILLARNQWHAR